MDTKQCRTFKYITVKTNNQVEIVFIIKGEQLMPVQIKHKYRPDNTYQSTSKV